MATAEAPGVLEVQVAPALDLSQGRTQDETDTVARPPPTGHGVGHGLARPDPYIARPDKVIESCCSPPSGTMTACPETSSNSIGSAADLPDTSPSQSFCRPQP